MSNEVRNPILAAVVGAGLAGVIAFNWQRHSFTQATDSREFLQTQYIDAQEQLAKALAENAASNQMVAGSISESSDAIESMAKQIDDMGDESRALNRWVEAFVRQSSAVMHAQEALQDEVDSLPRSWEEAPVGIEP